MKFKMCKEIWKIENCLTFSETFFICLGLMFCIKKQISYSMIILLLLGIFDGFDGMFSKKFRKNGDTEVYGIQLDSLADIITSAAYPVIILISMGYNSIINLIIYSIFIVCGLTRLSYFNIQTHSNKENFLGVPITVSTIVLPLLYIFTQEEIIFMVSMMILSVLYVCDIKIKKPNIKIKIVFAVIGVAISIVLVLKGAGLIQ